MGLGASHVREWHSYGPHELQRVLVSISEPSRIQNLHDEGYWVIYIHGGAWRDPTETAVSFEATKSALNASPEYASIIDRYVIAFASINYRLSRHPNFPQDSCTTDPTQLRAAKHPDHLYDVTTAIGFLQERYGFGERYILVGHSCGATLAYQTVMTHVAGAEGIIAADISKPKCLVGIEGIYDLKLLRDDYKQIPAYQEFLEEAFGLDEVLWDKVSPAKVSSNMGAPIPAPAADASGWCWTEGKLAVLAQSQNDELVNVFQAQAMNDALKEWKGSGTEGATRHIIFLQDLQESHNGVCHNGKEMAKVIATTVQELAQIDSSP